MGSPERVIERFVDEIQPDVVVMGTVARTGVKRLLLGNTAETVLGQLGGGVLFVKPPGFATPVSLAG